MAGLAFCGVASMGASALQRFARPSGGANGSPGLGLPRHGALAREEFLGLVATAGSTGSQTTSAALPCWRACQRSGSCDWCGAGMACCRADRYVLEGESKAPAECRGVGGVGRFECAVAVSSLGDACGGGFRGGVWHNCGFGLLCESGLCITDPSIRAEAMAAEAAARAPVILPPPGVPAAFCPLDGLTGGTCNFFPCDASLGPVDCIKRSCWCRPGYCLIRGVCEIEALPTPPPPVSGLDDACGAEADLPCALGLWCDAATSTCAPDLSRFQAAAVPLGLPMTMKAQPPPTTTVPPGLLHYKEDCWAACGHGGYCAHCGEGNACCRAGYPSDPPECDGVTAYGSFSHHACVKPVHTFTTSTTTLLQGLLHWAVDCWPACGKPGLCDWCGKGMACCRAGLESDPPVCHGAAFGRQGRHTCVAPRSTLEPTQAPTLVEAETTAAPTSDRTAAPTASPTAAFDSNRTEATESDALQVNASHTTANVSREGTAASGSAP